MTLAAGPGCVTNSTQMVSLSREQDLRLECSMAWEVTGDRDTESGHTGGLSFSWAVTLGNGSKEVAVEEEWTKDRANSSTLTLPYNRLVEISILYLLLISINNNRLARSGYVGVFATLGSSF